VRLTISHRKTLLLWNLNRGGQGLTWAAAPLDGYIYIYTYIYIYIYIYSRIGCVKGSVLAIWSNVYGFKSDWGDGFFRAIKMCSTPSFWGKVKPEATWKILRHLEYHLQVWTKLHGEDKLIISFTLSSNLLPDGTAGRNARELWWNNQEFSSVDIFSPWSSVLILHITWGINNRSIGGCSSVTQSHPINMIIIKLICM
jgi:hypothetical protein